MKVKFNKQVLNKKSVHTSRHRGKKPINKILLSLLLLVVTVVGAVLIVFFVMSSIGKRDLYRKSKNETPALVSDNLNGLTEKEKLMWEDDWVRYDGEIYDYNDDILTFLVMGIDQRNEQKDSTDLTKGGQADALFLVVLNPHDKSTKIIAINRDTMTDIDVGSVDGVYSGTVKGQIALQHGYGSGYEDSAVKTVSAVSNLFYDLPIHGYFAVNMQAISIINDEVGGVSVNVLEDLTSEDSSLIKGTTVTLKGDAAYEYVQHRDTSIERSNMDRLARQKQYLTNFISTAKNATKDNMNLPIDLYNELSPYTTTDIKSTDITYLAGTAIDYSFDQDQIYTLKGETKDGVAYEEFYPDEDELYKLILDVFYEKVSAVQ